ncbi:transposable element Tcb2 transposase [Trichonephila clavipes]|nr:transposable element Tcb2 transposase [Trichonephila clavipes]
MPNVRTELHIFDRGSVIWDRYCEEVLLPHVRLFRGATGPDFIFMDDNARPYRSLAVEELLESEDITRMDWPAYSPDLNPIEHVWDALGRRIAARLHHPENTQQLKQILIEEWALLPQEMLHQLVLSMRRRCETTIADKYLMVEYELANEDSTHRHPVVHEFCSSGDDFITVREVRGRPEHLASSTLSLPSLKRRCHSKACVREEVSQPYTCFKIL